MFFKKKFFQNRIFFQCAVTLKIVFKKGMTITNKFQTLQIPGWGMRSFAQNCSYYCSCSLKKSNHEQIALVALNKRATMSDLLRSLMTKEQPWANRSRSLFKRATVRIRSHYAWQKRDGSDLLFFTSESFFRSQKLAIRSKNWWANSQPLANTVWNTVKYTAKLNFLDVKYKHNFFDIF